MEFAGGITAEIPFGSLAADNKVPQLARDATHRLSPRRRVVRERARTPQSTYTRPPPARSFVLIERVPRSTPREPWAGTVGGAYPTAFTLTS